MEPVGGAPATPAQREIHIGVDIGQKVDPTALAVVELNERPIVRSDEEWNARGYPPNLRPLEQQIVFTARMLQRLPLSTSFPAIVARIVEVLVNQRRQEWAARQAGAYHGAPSLRALYMDETGVGGPVVELVTAAIAAHPDAADCRIFPLTFVHGMRYDRDAHRLGKAYLVNRLQVLMQTQRLVLPDSDTSPEAEPMRREIKDYDIHIDQDGHDTYGAFKTGSHDDLVTALGLACLDDGGPGVWTMPALYDLPERN